MPGASASASITPQLTPRSRSLLLANSEPRRTPRPSLALSRAVFHASFETRQHGPDARSPWHTIPSPYHAELSGFQPENDLQPLTTETLRSRHMYRIPPGSRRHPIGHSKGQSARQTSPPARPRLQSRTNLTPRAHSR